MKSIEGIANPYEEYLCAKASMTNTPIGGTFELLPYCNMNCKMCYIRMSKKEVDLLGGIQSKEFWIHIAKQAKEKGLLFLLLTGGEPLLYPDFLGLYEKISSMGIYITINTNGTLINEEIASFLGQHLPRRLNITIYGKDNATYAELCQNPKGFTQLEYGIQLLKKHAVPVKLNCSLTPYNYMQLKDIQQLSQKWDIPLEIAYYMMPPNRKTEKGNYSEHRLPPHLSAQIAFDIAMCFLTPEERKEKSKKSLEKIMHFHPKPNKIDGFWCRAANASFWITWRGEMVPCGMLNEPTYNITELGFQCAWENMIKDVQKISLSSQCYQCNKRSICLHCAASEISETGCYGCPPEYLCEFSDTYFQLLKKEAEL